MEYSDSKPGAPTFPLQPEAQESGPYIIQKEQESFSQQQGYGQYCQRSPQAKQHPEESPAHVSSLLRSDVQQEGSSHPEYSSWQHEGSLYPEYSSGQQEGSSHPEYSSMSDGQHEGSSLSHPEYSCSAQLEGGLYPEYSSGDPQVQDNLSLQEQNFIAHDPNCTDQEQWESVSQSQEAEVVEMGTETAATSVWSYSVDDLANVKKQKNLLGMKAATKLGNFSGGEYIAISKTDYEKMEGNYLRGCKWSPDGRVLLTNSDDNYMRLYHIPLTVLTEQKKLDSELISSLPIHESELVYDYCFYPGWKTEDDNTCMFATTCRDLPIHMHSAIGGHIVQSYRCYDQVDEITAPHSIGFTSDGKFLLAGFKRTIRCFVTDQPGRDCEVASTVVKAKDERGRFVLMGGQRGILSCFAAHPSTPYLVAAGDFNGNVAIYDVSRSCSFTIGFEGQFGGITHMVFSKDGNYLYTGGRKDPEINCFDIRNPEKVLYVMYRHVATNQRMYFDLDWSSRYLLSGNHNGNVSMWDLKGTPVQNQFTPWPTLEPILTFEAHGDSCNGCSVNPQFPLLATSSGQRHYDIEILMEDEETQSTENIPEENTLKIWNLKLP